MAVSATRSATGSATPPAISGALLLRAALLGTTALVFLGPTVALARVGVTSATDGDPRGKPPEEAERILRIGIDVQANELITTGGNDRAHLVFLDGTSLTVGPNAQLTIDKFVYDPNTKTGELAVSATRGVLRLVGGRISKTNPITVTTPSSTIGIRGGITLLNVQPTRTISTFVFGDRMTVSGQGQTQNVTRPGSQVTTAAGAPPGPPALAPQGALGGQLAQLEGTSGGGNNNPGGTPPGGPGGSQGGNSGGNSGGSQGGNPDQGAQRFSQQNSQQGPGAPPPSPPAPPPVGSTGGQLNGNSGPPTNPAAQILPNTQTRSSSGSSSGSTSSSSTTYTTRTIVSYGRFLQDPVYTPNSSFGPGNLGVTTPPTANPTDNQPLVSSTTVTTPTGSTNGTLKVTLGTTGETLDVPWMQGQTGFSAALGSSPFGALTSGTGYVSAAGDAFVYVFKNSSSQTLGFFGGSPTPVSDFPTTGYASYNLYNLSANGSTKLPFAPDSIKNVSGLASSASTSPLYAVFAYNPSTAIALGNLVPTANSGALQATIAINGLGSSQSSYMGVYVNQFIPETTTGSIAAAGVFGGTYRLSATQAIGSVQSAESTASTGSGNAIYGTAANSDAASTMVFTPDQVSLSYSLANVSAPVILSVSSTRTAQASLNQSLVLGNGTYSVNNSDYYSAAVASQTTTPSTLGQTRTAQTLTGFVGGLVDTINGSGSSTTSAIGSAANNATISLTTTPANNAAGATITAPVWGGNSSATATFKLGGVAVNATSLFIDDNTYAAVDVPASVGTSTSVTVGNGTSGGSNVTSATQIVSSGVAPVTSFLQQSGVTNPCTCQYLTWGWWGGSVAYGANSVFNPGGISRINLATYVAGNVTSTGDYNTYVNTVTNNNTQQASATYNGQMIGNVNNNGASYVAAGTYRNVWSFGAGTGQVSASFDGASFSGQTQLTGGTVNFTTPTAITTTVSGGTRSLTLNGSFFNAPGSTAAYQAGRFGVTGTSYQAAGTFAAQK